MADAALPHILALDDLEAAARRLLPRAVYGFAAGGVETDATLHANRAAFEAWRFVPRVLVDVAARNAAASLFGRRHAAPFGIAPMGGACMFRRQGDLELARGAEASGIPFVLSGVSAVRLETIRDAAPGSWFQAYFPQGSEQMPALIDRVGTAGYEVLVVTVDVAVAANRENNLRNGWSMPLRLGPRILADVLAHPRWLWRVGLPACCRAMPHFENLAAERGAPLFGHGAATQRATALDWRDIELIRRRWPGKLVLKGILSPGDAALAAGAGVDGIVVSNHGGRQLDHAAASLDMLPAIRAAVPGLAVLLDGGVRRGTDVLKALALGADFVLIGRPFLYATALAGAGGVVRTASLLKDEIARGLGMLGVAGVAQLTRECLVPAFRTPSTDNRHSHAPARDTI